MFGLLNTKVQQMNQSIYVLLSLTLLTLLTLSQSYADNRIDFQHPDAPALASYGEHTIGVRTLNFSIAQQINVLAIDEETVKSNLPRYDRPLTLELWYPAKQGSTGNTIIKAYMRDGKEQIALQGKAVRDAQPIKSAEPFPLVVISHGYPGNRFLMAHLAENIASKGYVVVSIDHTDSTYRTQAAFASTLINRPLDQEATLDHIAKLSRSTDSFLNGLVDTNNAALIGYSMGGYGALITAGAAVNPSVLESRLAPPLGLLSMHTELSERQNKRPDTRFKTIIAFAPWGKNYEVWTNQALANISLPSLIIGGSVDDVSGYENGIRAIFNAMTGATRSLLTFENANHSAGAPMPAPSESFRFDKDLGAFISEHYTDPVWDSARMNNISQHFVSAWLAKYLKNDVEVNKYLSLTPYSRDGAWSVDEQGKQTAEHSYWEGFKNRTAVGLRFETVTNN